MATSTETTTTTPATEQSSRRSHWQALWWLIPTAVFLLLIYARLLIWLGRLSLRSSQLANGAVLVLFAVAVCLRDTIETLRIAPALRQEGLLLISLGCISFGLAAYLPALALLLVLLSFCFSFAGVISFLFGKLGVRQFLPAFGAFLVFGVLAGLFPALDWPLRREAARYAANLLAVLGVPVQVGLRQGMPPQLLLMIKQRVYIVATECNGFGLLTSAVLLATILGFLRHLPWLRKLGLIALAVPIAIGCNFLRIVSICLVAPRVSLPYSWVHEILGQIFFFIGLALIWFAPGQNTRPPPPAPK